MPSPCPQAARAVGYGADSYESLLEDTALPAGAVAYFVELHIEQGGWRGGVNRCLPGGLLLLLLLTCSSGIVMSCAPARHRHSRPPAATSTTTGALQPCCPPAAPLLTPC